MRLQGKKAIVTGGSRGIALGEKARVALIGQIPVGWVATAEDVAALAGFLASDAAAYSTGQVIAVDGGLSM